MEHFFAENAITIEHRDWISKSKVQVVYIRRLYRNVVYKFSTSFSFSLKMFLSSPRVDSIFSREYCCSPVLGHPGVQLIDSVVQELPFLDQSVNLLAPVIGNNLHLFVATLQFCYLVISLFVCSHLVCSCSSIVQDV